MFRVLLVAAIAAALVACSTPPTPRPPTDPNAPATAGPDLTAIAANIAAAAADAAGKPGADREAVLQAAIAAAVAQAPQIVDQQWIDLVRGAIGLAVVLSKTTAALPAGERFDVERVREDVKAITLAKLSPGGG